MKNLDSKNVFIPDVGVVSVETFSDVYPVINSYIINQLSFQKSRAGTTKEFLDMKTIIHNPYRRCVGGCGRDINIFFLMAESMWIFNGRKDVEFLTLFNKKMEDFSDDGIVFHAPYGFRLRHWGVNPEDKFIEENLHASQGYDQISDAIKMLDDNPDTRQVVLSIWNPEFDLGAKSKDIPCNDLIMLKVRSGKLITTIQNRSNDLHWGLPTNIFQFSFLTEIIAGCLGIELGTQTHNSQSLHIYDWNSTATEMEEIYKSGNAINLYDFATERKIDFNFQHSVPGNRLREIDFFLSVIIESLSNVAKGGREEIELLEDLKKFSLYLWTSYQLCRIYLIYKRDFANASSKSDRDDLRHEAIIEIDRLFPDGENWDIVVLAKNFFASRLSDYEHKYLGKL